MQTAITTNPIKLASPMPESSAAFAWPCQMRQPRFLIPSPAVSWKPAHWRHESDEQGSCVVAASKTRNPGKEWLKIPRQCRRIFWFPLLGLTLLAGTAGAKPNIIFILTDDLGYGDVGVFFQNQRAAQQDRSVPFFTTPNIDTLARDGAMLTQHYSAAPVCAPSRASLLSGLTQGNCNVRDNQFDKALADSYTLATVLRQGGYATAAFGKWGLQGGGEDGKETPIDAPAEAKAAERKEWTAFPTRRGFDYFFGYVRHKDGHFHYPKEDQREVWENNQEVSRELDKCYTADLWTARAKKWIIGQTAAHPQQPFFIYLAYDTPHAKLQNPPCSYPGGGGLTGGVQWTGKPHVELNTATGTVDGYMFPDYAKATWDNDHNPSTPEVPWPDVQKRYANDVRRIDFCVGDVLQLLKDLKLESNTLVVFSSDNGPSMESYLPKEPYAPTFFRGFGPFDGIKRDTWEAGMREPTLARWPGVIPAGRTDDVPSGQWDWMNTFASAAGLPAVAASDGVSLLPALTGTGAQLPSDLYIEYFEKGRTPKFQAFVPAHRGRQRNQMQAVYLQGYKGIRYDIKSADDDFEIYDLAKDPQESHNLAGDPEFASLQAMLKARVLQVRQPNASAPRPYDDALVPPVPSSPATAPGLSWSLFQGVWPWMPDFRTLTPVNRGQSSGIDLAVLKGKAAAGLAFEGFLHVPQDGEYTFTMKSDTAAMLFLHEIRVIDQPMKRRGESCAGTVRLKAGWHPLKLYYRHDGGRQPELNLVCKMPDGKNLNLNDSSLRQSESKN